MNEALKRRAQRRAYVSAFNKTMIEMWKEQIVKLGVVRTGSLYSSIMPAKLLMDEQALNVELGQSFNLYGIYVNYGTGRNTWRGNPGDIGRDNPRIKKRWFDRKYFSSVMNIQEFYAQNTGQQGAMVIAEALNIDTVRRNIQSLAP